MPTINTQHMLERLNNKPVLMAALSINLLLSSHDLRSDIIEKEKWYEVQTYTIKGGKAVISVFGSLINDTSYDPWEDWGYFSTYSRIRRDFDKALADDEVKEIYMHIESGGGEAAGCFDLVDHIFQARGKKPIIAIIDDYAFSGAYAIASACDKIIISRTGGVGSVGVIIMHQDISQHLQSVGVNISIIKSGAKKDACSSYRPLSETDRADLQASSDDIYQLFISTVARNRGLTDDDVRATEADCYDGQKAIDIGFADEIAPARMYFETQKGNSDMPTPEASNSLVTKMSNLLGITTTASADKVIAGLKSQTEAHVSEELGKQKKQLEADFKIEKDTAIATATEAGRTAAIADQTAIFEACKAAGRTDLAGPIMAKGVSLADAQAELQVKMAKEDGGTVVSSNIDASQTGAKPKNSAVSKINARRNRKRGKR